MSVYRVVRSFHQIEYCNIEVSSEEEAINKAIEDDCWEENPNGTNSWISVNDRLPAMNVEVIALDDEGKISFAHRVDITVENHYRGWNIPSVEYWMPFSNPLED